FGARRQRGERGWSNLDYVTTMQREHNWQLPATPFKIELQAHIEPLQSQVTELGKITPLQNEPLQSQVIVLHRSRENNTSTGNPRLLLEIEAIKLVLREDNSALHTTSNKRGWFRIRVRLMQPLETPTEGGIATLRALPPNGEPTTGTDTTRGTQENHSDNVSDS
ncbi:hypothetical protein IGI04_002466, partial [Brassica rapa subsp. trilocularis]